MNIVIVDDERPIRLGLRRIIELSGTGYNVAGEASDGQEAIELLMTEPCDLLITDIRMPVIDGMELIARIREMKLNMEIVILSGLGEFAHAQEAIRLEVMDYILKPMNSGLVKGVLEAVKQKMAQKKKISQLRSQCYNHCTALADKLAEAIWQLDTRQRQQILQQIEAEVGELAANEAEVAQIYCEFTDWIITRLESRRNTQISSTGTVPAANFAEAKQYLAKAVEGMEEEIRTTRNWGQHGPIREAVDYIQAHYANPELTLHELLDLTGMSATYFYELFKTETGHSFKSYLINLRIARAKSLLGIAHCKTYEVGELVGYTDYPHFARLFKKVVGITPSEYKKNMQGALKDNY